MPKATQLAGGWAPGLLTESSAFSMTPHWPSCSQSQVSYEQTKALCQAGERGGWDHKIISLKGVVVPGGLALPERLTQAGAVLP